MSRKQFNALSNAQRAAVLPKGPNKAPRRRRARRARNPPGNRQPLRNGQGRRRGGRRNRGGRRTGNVGPNMRGVFGPQNVDRSAGYAGGPMIRNIKKMSAPEPFEGDELIATVLGSVGFATTQFAINPANPTTFPWFNNIAKLYERYRFTFLEFYFQHDVSQFATQGTTGLILLSALYDAASAAPTSKTQIEATDPRVICMPNENSCLTLDNQGMHPVGEPKYCLTGVPPGATDIKTYHVGNLFVTTQGMQNTSEIGELHVRYRGLLYDRILDASAAAAPANFSVSWFQSTSAQTYTTATPANAAMATATANGLGIVNTAGSFVPPAGNYLVDFQGNPNDTSSEAFDALLDLQKNGVSVYQIVQNKPQFISASALGVNFREPVSGSAFVTANGTDAFTLVCTLTGAAGTLTMGSSIRFAAM